MIARVAEKIFCKPVHDYLQNHCRSRAMNIIKNPLHPLYKFLEMLQSGKRYHIMKGRTSRTVNRVLLLALGLGHIELPPPGELFQDPEVGSTPLCLYSYTVSSSRYGTCCGAIA
ncbi:hypothetical protein AMECASPLE_037114 [Ameca splendens]|uniref:Uncharacterized protein n=1 Tax=Ameca splendens TaxID=208324 RepID=A0ABV1A3L0_9TELE